MKHYKTIKYRTVKDFERDEHNLQDGQRINIKEYGVSFTYERVKGDKELLHKEPLGIGAMFDEDILRLLGE